MTTPSDLVDPATPDARLRVRTLFAPVALGVVALVLVTAAGGGGSTDRVLPEQLFPYLLYALLLLGVARACRRASLPMRALVGEAPRDPHAWALVALAVPLLSIMVATMPALVSALAWIAPDLLREVLQRAESPATPSAITAAVVVAPVAEELVFRGVLLRAFAARWGLPRAIAASAAAFAVLHFDAIGALAFGVVMALLYLRTGSLLVPMACHALYNGVIVLAEPWLRDDGAPLDIAEARAAWWIGLLGIAGAVAIFVALVRRLRPEGAWRLPKVGGG